VFIIKAKVDNYSMGSEEENRVRHSLVKFLPKDTRAESDMLKEKLALFAALAD
jgi:ribosomal protein L35AE/L33A